MPILSKSIFFFVLVSTVTLGLLSIGPLAFAQEFGGDAQEIQRGTFRIVHCGDDLDGDGVITEGKNTPKGVENECDFGDFIDGIRRVINFLIVLSVPMAAVAFAWAGILYLTSGGSDQTEKAKDIFKKVAIGFIIVLGAWLIVNTVVSALLDKKFSSGLIEQKQR